jgi:photosystem II stability/assembly factor-like uncharacterized protein
MFKALPFLFLFIASFFVLNSCKKEDEVIDYHVMKFDVINNGVRFNEIVWYDDLHAMRRWYDQMSFTSDGGYTWSAEWAPPSDQDIYSMVYPQVDTAYIFARDVSDVEVWRTTDRGTTWTLTYTFQTGTGITTSAWARTSKKLFCITEASTGGYKAFRTLNAGVTWGAISTCSELYDLCAVTDSLFFAVNDSRNLHRSTLFGSNFIVVSGGIEVGQYVILPTVQKGFIVDLYGKIYASHDFGVTWNNVLNDPAGARVELIDAHESGLVFVAGAGAPLVSRDFGATWNYYHLHNVEYEEEYIYQSVDIIDATTVMCGVYDREYADYKLIKCHIE